MEESLFAVLTSEYSLYNVEYYEVYYDCLIMDKIRFNRLQWACLLFWMSDYDPAWEVCKGGGNIYSVGPVLDGAMM